MFDIVARWLDALAGSDYALTIVMVIGFAAVAWLIRLIR
jgi:hypothetical protein